MEWRYLTDEKNEVGCDEAGRGCLAGPVVAAAVILPFGYQNGAIRDSKKLSEKKRTQLAIEIKRDCLAYGIGIVTAQEIDEINILNASILAMHRAVDKLKPRKELLLIDGNRFKPYKKIKHVCVIKGDDKYQSIAAASILAKTYRDEMMETYHSQFPLYDFKNNKGYPTKKHREALRVHGHISIHRLTFQHVLPSKQMKLFEGEKI
jgi:ribonuclease HII